MIARPMRTAIAAALVTAACTPAADQAPRLSAGQQAALAAATAIFVASPAAIATAVARPGTSWRPPSAALVAALERDAVAAFPAARIAAAARALPLPPGVEPAAAIAAEAKLDVARRTAGATMAAPRGDGATIARLAARLPDTRLRADQGVATWRAAYALGIGGVDAGFARDLAPGLAASVATIVRTSRQRAAADTVLYPGPAAAEAAARAANVAALSRLDPDDVAALDAYYASPAGQARADGLLAIYRQANDAAATDLLQRFLSHALATAGHTPA